jgi:methyltransferase family protein
MNNIVQVARQRLKSFLGPERATHLRCWSRGLGVPRWGNLRRLAPFSSTWGVDRGTPIDRYYLHSFFEENRSYITGDVLEIQRPIYTTRFGSNLHTVHSVDIDPQYQPTYVCDLAKSEGIIPSGRYDCFLLPCTLSVLRDIENCLREALRVTKPGGMILAGTSGFVPLTPESEYPDYWHNSTAGWEEIARRVWPGCEVRTESYGNCLAAVATMLGLAHEELTPSELDVYDARYPVLVTLSCRKPAWIS